MAEAFMSARPRAAAASEQPEGGVSRRALGLHLDEVDLDPAPGAERVAVGVDHALAELGLVGGRDLPVQPDRDVFLPPDADAHPVGPDLPPLPGPDLAHAKPDLASRHPEPDG